MEWFGGAKIQSTYATIYGAAASLSTWSSIWIFSSKEVPEKISHNSRHIRNKALRRTIFHVQSPVLPVEIILGHIWTSALPAKFSPRSSHNLFWTVNPRSLRRPHPGAVKKITLETTSTAPSTVFSIPSFDCESSSRLTHTDPQSWPTHLSPFELASSSPTDFSRASRWLCM